jgi:anti-sigma regulatory factor (Ser/Thr protein kinase)
MWRVATTRRRIPSTREALAALARAGRRTVRNLDRYAISSRVRKMREFAARLKASAALSLAVATAGSEATSWAVAPSVRAPANARLSAELELVKWGFDPASYTDVLVVLDELVTNAVLHAATTITVTLARRGTVVTVAVRDHTQSAPSRGTGSTTTPAIGLRIVDALSAHGWSCTPHTGRSPGKTVWARMSLPQPTW